MFHFSAMIFEVQAWICMQLTVAQAPPAIFISSVTKEKLGTLFIRFRKVFNCNVFLKYYCQYAS